MGSAPFAAAAEVNLLAARGVALLNLIVAVRASDKDCQMEFQLVRLIDLAS